MNTCLVSMTRDAVLGNQSSHPDSSFLSCGLALADRRARCSLADKVHHPYFVWIANREGFALGCIAVFLHQLRHHVDGLACRSATFQGNVHQRAVVDDCRRIHQAKVATPSRFADGHLPFVLVTHHAICVCRLRNLSQGALRVPIDHLPHLSYLMIGSRGKLQIAVELMTVGIVTDHGRTVH